jgi:hypothetical protein
MKLEPERTTSEMGFSTPELMTEDELIQFLRIPEISRADKYHNVVEHLKRMRNLPRIQLCNKVLYPTRAILEWIAQETISRED